jgi:vancomycin resistance protein YoaR
LKYVRIVLPGEEFKFLQSAQYDGREQKNYMNGYAIIENEEIKVYGGGICGASTALYQGVVTNKALQPTTLRSHSKWFNNLYIATINGQLIKTPGIDSAIYDGVIDLHLKNVSNHPIIIVTNYDGSYGGLEEIFSLGRPDDLGGIEFVKSYRTSMEVPDDSPLPEQEVAVEADSFSSDWIRGVSSGA